MDANKKELIKNTSILAFGTACTYLVNFLLLPLYTDLLVPEDMGTIDLILTYISYLAPLFSLQIENGLFRYVIEYKDHETKIKRTVSSAIYIDAVQCIIVAAVFISIALIFHANHMVVMTVSIVISIFNNLLFQLARGIERNQIYALGSFIAAISMTVLDILFIAFFGMGIDGKFLSMILSKIICLTFLFCAIKLWNYFSWDGFDKGIVRDMLKYSVPMIPNNILWWVFSVSDRTVITFMIGSGLNGIYSVSNKFSNVYLRVYNVFDLAWLESVSRNINAGKDNPFFKNTINNFFRLYVGVGAFIVACMPVVFKIMVRNEMYSEAYWQIPLLMVAAILQMVSGLYSVFYLALKKTRSLLMSSFISAIANIAINLLLIKHIGLYAASVSTVVSFVIFAVCRYRGANQMMNKTIGMAKSIVIQTVFYMCVALMAFYLRNMYISIVVAVAIGFMVAMSNYKAVKELVHLVKNKAG